MIVSFSSILKGRIRNENVGFFYEGGFMLRFERALSTAAFSMFLFCALMLTLLAGELSWQVAFDRWKNTAKILRCRLSVAIEMHFPCKSALIYTSRCGINTTLMVQPVIQQKIGFGKVQAESATVLMMPVYNRRGSTSDKLLGASDRVLTVHHRLSKLLSRSQNSAHFCEVAGHISSRWPRPEIFKIGWSSRFTR